MNNTTGAPSSFGAGSNTIKTPIEFKRNHHAGKVRDSMETKHNHDALILQKPNLTTEEREKLNRSVVIMGQTSWDLGGRNQQGANNAPAGGRPSSNSALQMNKMTR